MIQLLSGLFVLIWATGFVVAGIVHNRADPLTFLTARYVLGILVFAMLSIFVRARWPRDAKSWRDGIVAGMLLHGLYLSGVFWAVSQGLGAGLTALVTGLHPLFTAALAAPLLHEHVTGRQWLGIAVGVLGVGLIVAPKIGGLDGIPLHALAAVLIGTLGFTLGNIWQKRAQPTVDLRVNATIQFIGALILTAPFAWLTEDHHFERTPALYGALAWAVLGLSVGGISILLVLLKRGAASKVAPLLYLSPPVAAIMALFLFGEKLALVQVCGMVLAVAGAFAARR